MAVSESKEVEMIRVEREFLHDLATPLTVAMGMSDSALIQLKKDEPEKSVEEAVEKAIEKIEKAKTALSKMAEQLSSRREGLLSQLDRIHKS